MKLSNMMIVSLLCVGLHADDFAQSQKIIASTNAQLLSIQKNIDKKDERKFAILNQIASLNLKLDNIKQENKALKSKNLSNENRLKSLKNDLENIDKINFAIPNLLKNMAKTYDDLLKQTTPFLLEKRKKTSENLANILHDPLIENSKKYSSILQAYQSEFDYSISISSYEEKIDGVLYNIFRLGNVALYRESLDKTSYGVWDKTSWKNIDDLKARVNISNAIKIAKKFENSRLLNLPFIRNNK